MAHHGSLLPIALLLVLMLAAAAAQAQKNGPTKQIDLNTASVDELEEVTGIGPTTAKAIVDSARRAGLSSEGKTCW